MVVAQFHRHLNRRKGRLKPVTRPKDNGCATTAIIRSGDLDVASYRIPLHQDEPGRGTHSREAPAEFLHGNCILCRFIEDRAVEQMALYAATDGIFQRAPDALSMLPSLFVPLFGDKRGKKKDIRSRRRNQTLKCVQMLLSPDDELVGFERDSGGTVGDRAAGSTLAAKRRSLWSS